MRLEVLLILALLVVGGLIYYKDGGAIPDMPNMPESFSFFQFSDDEAALDALEEESESDSETTPTQPVTFPSNTNTPTIQTPLTSTPTPTPESAAPTTPLSEALSLKKGQAGATDPQREYLILSLSSSYPSAITISGWRVKSETTKTSAEIPKGNRLLERYSDGDKTPIMLYPGEQAYLITGENPLRASFRENMCTGYLNHYGDFYPSLTKSCPLPSDELLQFGDISRGDEDCYDFVEDVNKCEITENNTLKDARLTTTCERFVDSVLTYRGCVLKHENDSTFFTPNTWRIYFEKGGELWRSTDETIVVQDENNNVITTLEY